LIFFIYDIIIICADTKSENRSKVWIQPNVVVNIGVVYVFLVKKMRKQITIYNSTDFSKRNHSKANACTCV